MVWPIFKRTCLPRLVRSSLRHDIMHDFSSEYDLYSNMSKGLPSLECLNTSVGIKVIGRWFRTMLHSPNNLTVLILWASSSNNKIRCFGISSLSDTELLSPCCSKYLSKISTSHAKLNFAFGGKCIYNQWMFVEWIVRAYMDNGGYCTFCTINCWVSMSLIKHST